MSTHADVAVVEDNHYNRMTFKKVLDHHGYSMKIYRDGMEFLKDYPNMEFSIILMDIRMPRLSGNEVMQALNTTYKDHPPVIAVSADVMEEQYAERNGYADFILKPFKLQEIRSVLNKHLQDNHRRSGSLH